MRRRRVVSWVNSDGRRNMPSGEVFTGPSGADGVVRFDVPSSPRGVEVAGISLEFRDGVVVSARADRGDEVLQAMLATDDGARRLGEIGIGTNFGIDRAVGMTLLDEKIGGTVHLALGRAYPETGGTNESAIHWDMICDLRRGGRLTADGEADPRGRQTAALRGANRAWPGICGGSVTRSTRSRRSRGDARSRPHAAARGSASARTRSTMAIDPDRKDAAGRHRAINEGYRAVQDLPEW